MTEPDLEAIRLRWEVAKANTLDNRMTGNPEDPVGVSTKRLSAVWDSTTDVPDLLELVKAVKIGWQLEKERADNAEAELRMFRERVEVLERTARAYAAAWEALRPSNPDVQAWHDARGPLLVAIRDLDS